MPFFLGSFVVTDKFDSSFATLVLRGAPAGTVFHTQWLKA